jgi:hypothetical protein
MSHGGNSKQSFAMLHLKPNGQEKTWVCMTEFHPIQQSLGNTRPVEFIGGAFQSLTLRPDQ